MIRQGIAGTFLFFNLHFTPNLLTFLQGWIAGTKWCAPERGPDQVPVDRQNCGANELKPDD